MQTVTLVFSLVKTEISLKCVYIIPLAIVYINIMIHERGNSTGKMYLGYNARCYKLLVPVIFIYQQDSWLQCYLKAH